MSRLIVKNLPKHVTEEKLKDVFGLHGQVTDVQLKYTKDGKFRHFGFVGFRFEDDAKVAQKYLNNTYIITRKIQIEVCAGLGDPNKPRAWSKYASDSTAYKNNQKEDIEDEDENEGGESIQADSKGGGSTEGDSRQQRKDKRKKKDEDLLDKYKNDPRFKEFMEAHAKSNKTLWGNDFFLDTVGEQIQDSDAESKSDEEEGDSLEEEKEKEVEEEEKKKSEKEKTVAKSDLSDLEYLKSKVVKKVQEDLELSSEENKGLSSFSDDDANDLKDVGQEKDLQETQEETKEPKPKKQSVEVMYTVKLRGFPHRVKRSEIKHFLCPLKPKSIRVPHKGMGIAYVGLSSMKELHQILDKNRSFWSGRRIFVKRYNNKKDPIVGTTNTKPERWKNAEEALKAEEIIAESGYLFVRNLPYTCTEEELEALFSKYGPLSEINVPIDRFTRKVKGFAFVLFLLPEHAMKAYTDLDGSSFQGRLLHILPGKAKKTVEELLETEGLSYKQKKELQQKAQAGSSHNWNTLFLGTNAVADIMAERYDTSKQEVLDNDGKQSVAVRLALGETQIVTETRDFLIDNGVHLDAFSRPPEQRSKTVILAKNLPARTSDEEIRTKFEKFGEIGRVLMPPSGVTAIIEFMDASEARTAFRRLAYSKFYHVPLYLEWAPIDVFTSPFSKRSAATSDSNKQDVNKLDASVDTEKQSEVKNTEDKSTKGDDVPEDQQRDVDDSDEEEEEEEAEPDSTIFVKNLSFSTDEAVLKKHFEPCGSIQSVSISRKKDMKNPGKLLSMGYGFVQFKKQESVQKALKTLQHSMLEDHCIELKRSNRVSASGKEVKTGRKKSDPGKQKSTKILVRNVPFQATRKEVADLFKTFGELKAVRLPKKMVGTGSHRGFAFVDYHTKHEAKRAFKALCQSTHLYGRRLVLEWAAVDETVEELRRKTADHFFTGPTRKKTKLSSVFQEVGGM